MIPLSPTREAIEARLRAIASNPQPLYLHGADLRPLAQGALELVATVEAERDRWQETAAIYAQNAEHWERRNAETASQCARFEDMARRVTEWLLEIERRCPCGARPETLQTHPHVIGCPVARALALMRLESFLDSVSKVEAALQTETHDGK